MNPINLDDPNAVRLRKVASITHTLTLELDNAPALPLPFGVTEFIPFRAVVTIEHDSNGDLLVETIELTGHRAKKDGCASVLSSAGRWHRRVNVDGEVHYGFQDHEDHPYVLNVAARALAIMGVHQ